MADLCPQDTTQPAFLYREGGRAHNCRWTIYNVPNGDKQSRPYRVGKGLCLLPKPGGAFEGPGVAKGAASRKTGSAQTCCLWGTFLFEDCPESGRPALCF